MKKIHLLWPTFISYIIISLTAIMIPGRGSDKFSIEYGFPCPFLLVDKETMLTVNDRIIDNIAISIVNFAINVIILVLIINIFIFIYRVVFRRKRGINTKKANNLSDNQNYNGY